MGSIDGPMYYSESDPPTRGGEEGGSRLSTPVTSETKLERKARNASSQSREPMNTSFQLVALPAERFAPLFRKRDAELEAIGARRMVVHEKPGFPCRVSLADAEVGETVLFLPFTHHDVSSPYRAAGPIFIRSGAATASPSAGEIPAMFRHRLLSIRAYDAG